MQWHRYSATTYSHKSMLYGIHWIHRLHRLPDYQTPRLSKNPYRVQPLNPNPLKSCFHTAHKYPRKKIINIECPLHPHTPTGSTCTTIPTQTHSWNRKRIKSHNDTYSEKITELSLRGVGGRGGSLLDYMYTMLSIAKPLNI